MNRTRPALVVFGSVLVVALVIFSLFLTQSLPWMNEGIKANSSVELDFGPSDVEYVEVYYYDYAEAPHPVMSDTITDRREIANLVFWFTDQPGEQFSGDFRALDGAIATGFRFALKDDRRVETTHVFTSPNTYFGPDGTVIRSEYGSPLLPGRDAVEVDPATRPMTER